MAAQELETGGYSPQEAAVLVGVSWQTIDSWDRLGLVKPSILRSRGSGKKRLYSYTDLVVLSVVAELRSTGIPMPRVKRVLTPLKKSVTAQSPLSSNTMLIDDGVQPKICQYDEPSDLLVYIMKTGQRSTYLLDLSQTARDLGAKLRQLQTAA